MSKRLTIGKKFTIGLMLFACLSFTAVPAFAQDMEVAADTEAAVDVEAEVDTEATADTENAIDLSQFEDSPEYVEVLAQKAEAEQTEAEVEQDEAELTDEEQPVDEQLADAEQLDVQQIFVVAAKDNTSTAEVSMHQKDADGNWKQLIKTEGLIGKSGLGKTKEGDMKTPVGFYHFNAAFGIKEDPGCTAFDYHKVTEDDYWSGDQREGYHYNEMVSVKDYPNLNRSASEHLINYNNNYEYCLNISWNEECTPGKGSAIFLHCRNPYGSYTCGCVSIPEDQMIQVLKYVDSDCVVVIDSQENINAAVCEADEADSETVEEGSETVEEM